MNQDMIYTLTGMGIFSIGLFGLLVSAHIIRKLIALNIMGIGIFMFFLVTALHENITDPVPHAMVLTGIVVAVAGTALCIWLALNIRSLGNQDTDLQDSKIEERAL